MAHSQALAEVLQPPSDVVVHGGLLDPDELGHLAHRAAVAVYQDYRMALPQRQGSQRCGQPGLEAALWPAGNLEQHSWLSPPAAALPDPVEVSRQVLDVPQPLPVLPRISQSLSRRVAPGFETIGGDKRAPQPRLGLPDELLEAVPAGGHRSNSANWFPVPGSHGLAPLARLHPLPDETPRAGDRATTLLLRGSYHPYSVFALSAAGRTRCHDRDWSTRQDGHRCPASPDARMRRAHPPEQRGRGAAGAADAGCDDRP